MIVRNTIKKQLGVPKLKGRWEEVHDITEQLEHVNSGKVL